MSTELNTRPYFVTSDRAWVSSDRLADLLGFVDKAQSTGTVDPFQIKELAALRALAEEVRALFSGRTTEPPEATAEVSPEAARDLARRVARTTRELSIRQGEVAATARELAATVQAEPRLNGTAVVPVPVLGWLASTLAMLCERQQLAITAEQARDMRHLLDRVTAVTRGES